MQVNTVATAALGPHGTTSRFRRKKYIHHPDTLLSVVFVAKEREGTLLFFF